MKTSTNSPQIVTRTEWLEARRALLVREKELTRQHEAVAAARRQLPWVEIDAAYAFTDEAATLSLGDLFAGRRQLIVYHFMFGPGWEEGCKSCSFLMDHIDGMQPHLKARDITFAAVSRASAAQISAFKARMGWTFPWYSDVTGEFCSDFHVSFTRDDMEAGRVFYNYQTFPSGLIPVEDLPGVSVFSRSELGDVFHTYSAYSRGLEGLIGAYHWMDLTPRGRDEKGFAHPMAWLRHHDRYDADYVVDPHSGYTPPRGSMFNPCCGAGGQ